MPYRSISRPMRRKSNSSQPFAADSGEPLGEPSSRCLSQQLQQRNKPMSPFSYKERAAAKKILDDFHSAHPEIKSTKERYFFGLFEREVEPSFNDLITQGIITPSEADTLSIAQLILACH